MDQNTINTLMGVTALYLPTAIMAVWLIVYILRRGYSAGWIFFILVLGFFGAIVTIQADLRSKCSMKA